MLVLVPAAQAVDPQVGLAGLRMADALQGVGVVALLQGQEWQVLELVAQSHLFQQLKCPTICFRLIPAVNIFQRQRDVLQCSQMRIEIELLKYETDTAA